MRHYDHDNKANAPPYRLVILERGLELAEGHVGGGAPIVALDIILVQLQGSSGICQCVAIALGAQVGQTPVTAVDGIGGV